MKLPARAFIALVGLTGGSVLLWGALHWTSRHPFKFIAYLAVALLASRLKVHLPVITGTMSVNFLFIFLGIVELSLPETLLLGCSAILMQCFYRDRPPAVRVIFNLCASACAIAAAYEVYRISAGSPEIHAWQLFVAATSYFLCNTVVVAMVISLTEETSFLKVYKEYYLWSLPYYLLGAGIVGLAAYVNRSLDWVVLLIFPAVYTIYRSYRLYVERLEHDREHAQELAELHLRTVEALALAIEAKDHKTHDHLQRVRIYALEIAKELSLSSREVDALLAAALLHDIGKLAVPEHIISKPGQLTPDEFEKMKVHPVVGAEILERVRFPYPVVPIVRAHHEKWDGTGYPFGLKGEEIPIGARILSALDFFDALASDRPYRPRLPLSEVMTKVEQESGKSFDPRIVSILRRRFADLEVLVQSQQEPIRSEDLSDTGGGRGVAPAAGFSMYAPSADDGRSLASIAGIRREAKALYEFTETPGVAVTLQQTLALFSVQIQKLLPYDALAIYIRREDQLVPEHVDGHDFRLLSKLRIPVGEGLSGWVAQKQRPIVNGNPQVEPGYIASEPSTLMSCALSVPLQSSSACIGALTLYNSTKDAFNADHLRILLAIASEMGPTIEMCLTRQYATEPPYLKSLALDDIKI